MFRDKFTELAAILMAQFNEVNPISNLRVLCDDDAFGSDVLPFDRQHYCDLRSYLHREHRLDVTAAEADLISACPHRRCAGQSNSTETFAFILG